jgi:nucleotidyltransferase substrate binding protein (TIGR01987 family)
VAKTLRWMQRFDNFSRAYHELQEGVQLAQTRELSKLEKQGLIQGFEYTHELAWNTLKDYLNEKGLMGIIGSKDTTREAFKNGLIAEGDVWMQMINARNLTSHTYDTKIAETVFNLILKSFYIAFTHFEEQFKNIIHRELEA